MNHRREFVRLATAVSFTALSLALVAPAAKAQEAAAPSPAQSAKADEQQTIVVTGSRIATGFNAPTPVTIIGAERLEERASPNIGEALNEIPAFRGTQTPASTGLSPNAGGYIGGRILDLRGLGSVRTLTLLDGQRFVPSTTEATVDTNMIPSILLSRVEVVTGGASAVYGSDAVAGVVNLILDKKFVGYRFNAQYGESQYGDDKNPQIGIAGGWAIGSNLHLVLGAEYERNTGVESCPQRDWCSYGLINYGRNPGVTSIPANNILSNVHPWTAPYNGVTTPPTAAYNGRLVPVLRPIDGITFNADGTPRRYQLGTLANTLYSVGSESDGPGQNIYFDFPIVSPTERWTAAGHLNWEATPALTIDLTINYGHGEGDHRSPAYRNTAITIKNTNAYLPRSTDPTLDIPTILATSGLTSFTLGKGFADVGPAPNHTTNNVYRGVISAAYEIGGSWKADAYYQYGRDDFRRDLIHGTLTNNILKSLDSVRLPNGNIVCGVNADASVANDDPACVPLDPFGSGQGASFASAVNYVTANGFQENHTTEHVAAANLTGSLLQLPGGPLGVAVGAEYRNDAVTGSTDPNSQARAFFMGGGSVVSGKIEVIEGYAETEVPILRDVTFARELSLNGAVRRTHYNRSSAFAPSSSVDATTWKIGGVWAPVDAIRLRATRSRDIRAPNISELFGPLTSGSGILTDPARGGIQTVAPLTLGSNPNLRPENSNTFTAGVVLQPRGGFLGRFRGSADWFNIQIGDAISTLGQQNIATRCSQGDALSCSLITRDGNGIITNITDVYQNVNKLIARGIDFELDYRQPLFGSTALDLRVLATYYKDLITVDAVGATQRAGQTGLRGGTPPGIPDWTADATAKLSFGRNVDFVTHVRWINKGFYNAAFVGPDQPGYSITLPNSSSTNDMPSRTYVDLLATFRFAVIGNDKPMAVYIGVDNVANIDPPAFPGANGSGNNVLFNPVGRFFKAGMRVTY